MDLVLYRKQGVVVVDLASGKKYSYGPRTVSRGWWGWILLWVESTVIDVRYRDVRYRDVRYRDVGYRDSKRFTLCAIGIWCSLRGALSGYFAI